MGEEHEHQETGMATTQKPAGAGGLMPVQAIKGQLEALHELMREVLKDGEDYGTIPGVKKKSLWKPGAEKICTMFRLDPQYEVLHRVLDEDFILYDVKCTLYNINTGQRLGSGVGSCNSREEKYYWRKAYQNEFNAFPVDKRRSRERRKQDGGTYTEYQVRTNPYDYLNTIEKMAAKRAQIAATLVVTNASAIFTQDVEDMPHVASGSEDDGGVEAPSPPSEPDDGTISEGMVRMIHVLCGKLGVQNSAGDKDRHEYCSTLLIRPPDRFITSFKSLSFNTGKWLINTMQAMIDEKNKAT